MNKVKFSDNWGESQRSCIDFRLNIIGKIPERIKLLDNWTSSAAMFMHYLLVIL